MFQRPQHCCSRNNRECLERHATRCDRVLYRASLLIFLFSFAFMVMSSAAAGKYWVFINTQPWKPNTDEYQLRWLVAILLGILWFLTTALTVTYFLKLFSKVDYGYTPMIPSRRNPDSTVQEPFDVVPSSGTSTHPTAAAQGNSDSDIES